MTHSAPQPTRATIKTTIAFGKLTIPVGVYCSTDSTKIRKIEFTGKKAPAKAGDRHKNLATGRSVKPDDVYLVATATDGSLVRVTNDEVTAAQHTEGPHPVLSFVFSGRLGVEFFPTKVYQVRPAADDLVAQKAWSLLLRQLLHTSSLALIKLPLSGTAAPSICLLNAQGYLMACSPSDGVRAPLPLAPIDGFAFSATEIAAAERETQRLLQTVVPTNDDSAQRVQAMIDAKAAAGTDVVTTKTPVVV